MIHFIDLTNTYAHDIYYLQNTKLKYYHCTLLKDK